MRNLGTKFYGTLIYDSCDKDGMFQRLAIVMVLLCAGEIRLEEDEARLTERETHMDVFYRTGDPVTVLDTEIVAANRTHSEIGGDRGGAILAAVEAETNSTRLQVAGDRAAVNSEGGKTEANWTRSELMKGGDGEKAAMVAVEQTALLDRKAGGKARETAEDDVVPATNKLPDAADKLGHEGDRRWKHMEKTVFIDVKVLNKGEKRVPPIHLGTEKSEHEEGIGSRYVEQLINLHVSSEDESEDEELERALGKLSPPDVEALEAFPPAPSSDLPGADEDNSENEEEVDDYDDPYAMLLNRAEPATEQAESVAQLERINKIYRAVIAMDGYNPPNVQRVFQGHDPKQIVISGDGFRESTACYFSGSAPARMVKVAAKFISHKRILCVVPDDVLLPGTRFTVMVGSDVTGFAAPMYMQTAADNVKHDGSINLALSPRFIFAGLLTILIISYVATNKVRFSTSLATTSTHSFPQPPPPFPSKPLLLFAKHQGGINVRVDGISTRAN